MGGIAMSGKRVMSLFLAVLLLSFPVPGPVANAAEAIIDVADYGAEPGDDIDDGEAIRRAIDDAVNIAGGAEVRFSSGKYLVSPPAREWFFDQDGNNEGWTMDNQVSGAVAGGIMTLTISGSEPYILSSQALAIRGEKHSVLRIRMKNNTAATTASFWWTTQEDSSWTTARSQTFNITAGDAEFKEYEIDLAYHSEWAGKMIKQLRLDPGNEASTGTIDIDYIQADVPSAVEWGFDSDGNMEGWSTVQHLSSDVSGGLMSLSVTGGEPQLLSPEYLSLHSSKFSEMTISMKNNTTATTAKIRYITDDDPVWDERKVVPFTISANDASVKQYKISLAGIHNYGIMRQIMIEPVAGVSTGTVDIDFIRFDPPNSWIQNFYFNYEKANNGLTLKGNGTELMFTDPFFGPFRFYESSNITVEGFTVDFQSPPFAQGTINACDSTNATLDFVPDAGYSAILDDPRTMLMPSRWGTVRDPNNTDLQKASMLNLVTVLSWTKLDAATYRLQLPLHLASKTCVPGFIEANDKFVFSYRGTGFNVFDIRNDTNITIRNITVHKGPGTTITGQNLDGTILIDNLNVLRRDPGQYITTPADGIHIQFSVNGPIVRNSTFEGMLDDAINFYQSPTHLLEVLSPNKILVRTIGRYSVNDQIQVFDTQTGRIRGTATITSMESVAGFDLNSRAIWNLDRDITGMTGGINLSVADSIFNLTKNFRNYEISGSTFRESRRYGVLVRPGNGQIVNNSFIDLGGAGIAVQNEPGPFAYEGPMAENVLIANNTFVRNNYLTDINSAVSGGKLTASAIQIWGEKAGKQVADTRGIKNITIRDNTISQPIRNAILIAGTDTVTFEGVNTITSYVNDPVLDGDLTGIKIENAANITMNGVSITDPRPELNAGVQVGTAVEHLNAGTMSHSLATGVPGIMKLAPDAPVDLTVTGKNSHIIELDWTDTIGASTYNVYRGTTAGFVPSWDNKICCNVSQSFYRDGNLSPSTTYYYKVTAANSESYESASSIEASGTTLQESFVDDFEDGNSNGWTASSGTWSVTHDGTNVYRQSQSLVEGLTIADSTAAADSIISARIKMTEEGSGSTGSGIVFRYVDADNYYWLNLRRANNQLRLLKKVAGTWSQVTAVTLPQSLDTWYTLKVEAAGSTIRGYVDGVQHISAQDTSLASGKAGFRTYNTSTNIDDVEVGYGVTTPSSIPAPFVDGFEDGTDDGWTRALGSWSVPFDGANVYRQSSTTGEGLAYHIGTGAAANYVAETRLKITGDNGTASASGVGMAFRVMDSNNYYWLNFKHRTNELRLMKKVAGTWSQVAIMPFQQSLDTWYDLKVVANCDSIRVYVDGVNKFNIMDSSLVSGGIGFRTFLTTANFDDVKVTYEIPEETPPTDPDPLPQPVYLFNDDFEDGNTTGWTTSGGIWGLATDRTLALSNSATIADGLAYAGNLAMTDYTYEARVKAVQEGTSSTGIGLAFRVQDVNNLYWFNLRNPTQTVRLMKKLGGTWSQISSVNFALSLDTWYTIKVVVSGNSIRCFINGTEVISATDSTITNGAVGFRTYNTSAVFDYITVKE
jgi:hypothetical protein